MTELNRKVFDILFHDWNTTLFNFSVKCSKNVKELFLTWRKIRFIITINSIFGFIQGFHFTNEVMTSKPQYITGEINLESQN